MRHFIPVGFNVGSGAVLLQWHYSKHLALKRNFLLWFVMISFRQHSMGQASLGQPDRSEADGDLKCVVIIFNAISPVNLPLWRYSVIPILS